TLSIPPASSSSDEPESGPVASTDCHLSESPSPRQGLFIIAGLSHRGVQLSTGAAVVLAHQVHAYLTNSSITPKDEIITAALKEVVPPHPGCVTRNPYLSRVFGSALPPLYLKELLHSHLEARTLLQSLRISLQAR